jgi:predicted 3-demethylubiquinone-9 3-methyltransferase (glyoxalase superfamily)
MFDGQAEEAIRFYVSLFPGSEIIGITRYGPNEAGAEGTVMRATFSIAGQSIMCTDSIVRHAFTFTPAMSFFVTCESDDEIRRLASALSADGNTLMPLGSYGFSHQFTWVSDRYGISWQLNLP